VRLLAALAPMDETKSVRWKVKGSDLPPVAMMRAEQIFWRGHILKRAMKT
jgi:hypothetical protein